MWHAPIILPRCLFLFFCMAQYREKKMFEVLIYFVEGIKISTKCVLTFLSLSCNLVVV